MILSSPRPNQDSAFLKADPETGRRVDLRQQCQAREGGKRLYPAPQRRWPDIDVLAFRFPAFHRTKA
jgi:hypothetical protein